MGLGRSNLAWLAALSAAGAVTACTPKPAEPPAQQAPVVAAPTPTKDTAPSTPPPTEEPAAVTTPNLECALSAPAKARVGEPVEVLFRLTNRSAQAVYILPWQSPLEGLMGPAFDITRDGEEVSYQGPMVKRRAPSESSYVTIAPGATAENRVEVTQAYDFQKPGTYRIAFRNELMDVTSRKEDVPRPGGDYKAAPVKCAPVDVVVTAR
ncbi:protease [Corallococcus sp. CA053C]|uniref:protease n=1 Tax=Corallococcus sp. CA053C TaxID=2316732 RepID=UPI0018F4D835|nr:protease [Corallococcus sp. CA053C]